MKIDWTEPAVESLEAIHDYIARDSEFYADRFIARILHAVEILTEQPEIGRKTPEANRKDIREIIFQAYRIIYKIEPYKIQIITVVHGSRNLSGFSVKPWEVG